MYHLVKTGYGSGKEIENMNLMQYFDILLKELIDGVKELRAMKMDVVEISKKTKLSITQVKQLL